MIPPENDPLSKLLKGWHPKSPHAADAIARNVQRIIRSNPRPSVFERWAEVLGEWLPSPSVLIPTAAALIALFTAFQWGRSTEIGRELAAQTWQAKLSTPLPTTSLAGAYIPLTQEIPKQL